MERIGMVLGLVAVMMGGCAQSPTRIVIEDSDENVPDVLAAIEWLEGEAGCTLFDRVIVGGRDKDWRGPKPPIGTITVQIVDKDHRKLRGNGGRARHGIRHRHGDPTRCRVYAMTPDQALLAHELSHCLGLDHTSETFMGETSIFDGIMNESQREHLQSLCLD